MISRIWDFPLYFTMDTGKAKNTSKYRIGLIDKICMINNEYETERLVA